MKYISDMESIYGNDILVDYKHEESRLSNWYF